MLENVPADIVKDIKKMEQEFLRLQRCVSQLDQDYDPQKEPILKIPRITETFLKF